jgi:hypothetical protein
VSVRTAHHTLGYQLAAYNAAYTRDLSRRGCFSPVQGTLMVLDPETLLLLPRSVVKLPMYLPYTEMEGKRSIDTGRRHCMVVWTEYK